MKRSFAFFKRPHVSIWLLLTILICTACSSPGFEPSVESDAGLTVGDSQIQQSYPAPEPQPVEEQSQPSYPGPLPGTTPISRPTAMFTVVPPPICDFKPPVEVKPEQVPAPNIFSEIEVIPLRDQMFGFGIANWLPDNHYLLATAGDTAFGTISLVDTHSGEIKYLAERRDISSKPVWIESRQGVMYVDTTKEEGWEIRFSRGLDFPVETLSTHLASIHLSANPETEEVAFLLPGQPDAPVAIGASGQTRQLSDALAQSELASAPLSVGDAYDIAWSHNGKWLVQYGVEGLLLTDVFDKRTCRLELGSYSERGQRWAVLAQWSADDRYLGLITTVNDRDDLLHATELTIVDLQTGYVEFSEPNSNIDSWKHFVNDITWSPNGHEIMAKITVEEKDGIFLDGLFLVSPTQRTVARLLPEQTFYSGTIGQGLAWSPNGEKLALTCPGGPLCLIEVTQK